MHLRLLADLLPPTPGLVLIPEWEDRISWAVRKSILPGCQHLAEALRQRHRSTSTTLRVVEASVNAVYVLPPKPTRLRQPATRVHQELEQVTGLRQRPSTESRCNPARGGS